MKGLSGTGWIAVLTLALGTAGVSDPGLQADVKAVVGGVAGLVALMHVVQTHISDRRKTQAAAMIHTHQIDATAAFHQVQANLLNPDAPPPKTTVP